MTNETMLAIQNIPEDKRNNVQMYVMANSKDWGAAFALCFCLGGFGAHHFYLGNTGRAVAYLLFCWTFIPAIISFFELFFLKGMVADKERAVLLQAKMMNNC